jgi:hypothetical protein
MTLAKLNEVDLDYVTHRLREDDLREVMATRWTDDPVALTSDIMSNGEFGWIAGTEDRVPVAAFGAIPVWNGVWEVWLIATEDWPKVALGVTKFIKKTMIPAMREAGVHRAQCRSIEGHETAHRWLEFLGAHRESTMPKFGRDGETFHLYCWTEPGICPR